MKQLRLLLLFLLPLWASAQVSTGQEQFFDYGIQVEPTALQSISTPTYYGCVGIDGTFGRTPAANVTPTSRTLNINGVSQDLSANRTYRTAQADTGVLTFTGLTTNSATTIDVGAVVGVVVDNETNPLIPTYTLVNYAGATNVTVTTVGSGQASYVMLSSAGAISFQTTFPTSAERKEKIWLGKVSHPAGAITIVVNEPDYITSPMAFSRDILQSLGGFINNGVYPVENGANLNMNITGGTILGDGVNFVSSRTNPNFLNMGPNIAATFSQRTRTGGVTAGVTSIDVGFYDADGDTTPDAISGPGATSTLRYIYAIPGLGYVVQYGQNTYSSLGNAIAAIGKEPFIKWPNLENNAILIGVLAARKDATSLRTQDGQAQFFQADRLGGLIGSTAGVSTATFQSVYNNSSVPQITTSVALGALEIKRGSASDTDNVLKILNGSGLDTVNITGNGDITASGQLSVNSNNSTGAIVGESTDHYGVFATTQSTAKPGLYAQNANAGDIAQFWNSSTNVAKIDNDGDFTAKSFIKTGGTSTQGLLADGSVLTNPMDLGSGQTVTGVKTYNDGKLGLRNVANTFTSFFTNANTASRTYTLPDASGTLAIDSGLMHLAGNETFSGTKTMAVSSGTPALNITNSIGGQASITMTNTTTSTGILMNGTGNRGIDMQGVSGIGLFIAGTTGTCAQLSPANGTGMTISCGASTTVGINMPNNGANESLKTTISNSAKAISVISSSNQIAISASSSSTGDIMKLSNLAGATSKAVVIDNATTATGKPFQYTKNSVEKSFLDDAGVFSAQIIRLTGYTVATLPTGTVGDTAFVTDALTPTYLTTIVGGGAVKCPVFFDGTNWVAH